MIFLTETFRVNFATETKNKQIKTKLPLLNFVIENEIYCLEAQLMIEDDDFNP